MATSRHKRQAHRALYALRVNEGLSRADLGRRIGVSAETIRLAEIGFLPTPRIQFAIAQAFAHRPLDLWPIERQRIPA
jgi:transcriptional regulator with XRE-family HTH domain